jgi:hypothetical protein
MVKLLPIRLGKVASKPNKASKDNTPKQKQHQKASKTTHQNKTNTKV